MIGGSIPPAGADLMWNAECGVRNAECGVLDTQWVQWGYLIHFDRGSANGRLPDFESGDGGSIPPPRAQFCREPNEQANVFCETVTNQ